MDVFEKVREITAEHFSVEKDSVTEDASFIKDLGADSLDLSELIMEFEEEFDIEIPDEDTENLQTVGDAVKYLESRLGE
jgi:acyl carrier protein